MTIEKIKKLLNKGECLTVEYKECVNGLNNSVFETVSSFSNRYGGHLILGAEDSGKVIGVNPASVKDMKKNFINLLNNPTKISPSLLLELEEYDIDGKIILYVYVPASSQVILCSNKVYDRVGDADIDITKSTELMADLYGRKSAAYTEREIFPYVTENELRFDLVERAKKMALSRDSEHAWKDLSEIEIIRSAGLYDEDWRTGKKGFNLACILLFGKDEVISSCAPGFETDTLVRRENIDRYDDRLIVGKNLIEAYDKLFDFIAKHTLDRFFLVDNQNVSVRSWISRELVSNILVHREYSKGFPAQIVIERDCIYTTNWNRSNKYGRLDPRDFTPEPKNPILARFFVHIGRADKLGSGVRNLYKYTKIYSGGEPELIEGDVFKTIVPLIGIGALGSTGDSLENNIAEKALNGDDGNDNGNKRFPSGSQAVDNRLTTDRQPLNATDRKNQIVELITDNEKVTSSQLIGFTGLSQGRIRALLRELVADNEIEKIGDNRYTFYITKKR